MYGKTDYVFYLDVQSTTSKINIRKFEIRYSSIIPCLCLDLNNKVYLAYLFFTREL